MSFEAVPCMFTGRAEDGHEEQLFGLLIRPSNDTSSTTSTSSTSTIVDTSANTITNVVTTPSLQKQLQQQPIAVKNNFKLIFLNKI